MTDTEPVKCERWLSDGLSRLLYLGFIREVVNERRDDIFLVFFVLFLFNAVRI